MAGPILMNLTTPHPCPSSILMTSWGAPSSYLWMRMGRGRGLPFLSMSRISINHSFHLTNSPNITTMEVPTTYLLSGRLGSKHGNPRIATSGRKLLFMTRNTSSMHKGDTRRLEYILYLMSNTVKISKLDL